MSSYFTRFGAIVSYTEVFQLPLPADRLSFVKHYPTVMLVAKLAHMNAILFNESAYIPQHFRIFREVLQDPTIPNSPLFAQVFDQVKAGFRSCFSSAVISSLIKDLFERPDAPFEVPASGLRDFFVDLFRTILVYNETYFQSPTEEQMRTFEGLFHLAISQQQHLRNGPDLQLITGLKLAFFTKFLVTKRLLRPFTIEYCDALGISDPWMVGKLLLSFYQTGMAEGRDAKYVLGQEHLPSQMLADFTFVPNEKATGASLYLSTEIIPRPFYRVADDAWVVLDYAFLQYTIGVGVFYHLYQKTSLRKLSQFRKYTDFSSYIAKSFFEEYLVAGILRRIFFRPFQKVLSTDKYQDFIVRYSNNVVFIFEVKMASLHYKVVEEREFEAFKKFLVDNLASQKSTGGKDKGIAQLIRQINFFERSGAEFPPELRGSMPCRWVIYPVILFADAHLDLEGVNEFLREKFDEQAVHSMKESANKVKPLLLLNINVLLEYFDDLIGGKTLLDWIERYHEMVRKSRKSYKKHHLLYKYHQYNQSFSNFVRGKSNGDPLLRSIKALGKQFNLNIEPTWRTDELEGNP